MKHLLFSTMLLMSFNIYAQFGNHTNFENKMDIPIIIGSNASDSLWQIGVPQKTILDAAFSLPNALITDTLDTYPINQSAEFIIQIYQISNTGFPLIQLDWEQKTDLEMGVDGMIVEASYDETNSWNNVFTDPSLRPLVVGQYILDTLFNGEVGFAGSTDWEYVGLCWGTWFSDDGTDVGIFENLNQNNSPLFVRFTFISDSIDTQQEGFMMDDFGFKTEIVGAVNGNQITPQVKMFPNPASDHLTIEFEDTLGEEALVQIFSLVGRKVYSAPASFLSDNTLRISTTTIDPGQYFLRVRAGEHRWTGKFFKE